jgi:hypothetical protein
MEKADTASQNHSPLAHETAATATERAHETAATAFRFTMPKTE